MRSVKDIILKDTEPGPGLHEVVTCQAASYRQSLQLFYFPPKIQFCRWFKGRSLSWTRGEGRLVALKA